jgi:hypothetical protein
MRHDDFDAWRGILFGLLFSAPFWIAIGLFFFWRCS